MPLDETMQGSFAETQLAVPLETHMSLNFDSLQKLSILLTVVSLLSFCAVSPRTLPTALYNERFRRNLALLALPLIAPMIEYSLVLDARENDVNNLVTAFYASFTVGYTVSFMLEIILTTVIRLGVFALWEPSIFNLTPKVPSLVLPWVLREQKYRPKRITLFAADFFTSCIASPIVEEYMKLKILQLTARLPRNYRWTAKKSSKSNRKKLVAEPVARAPGESDVSNINRYVTSMLAVSLGIKLCDGARRILMYTKPEHKNKAFYALCRGIFPIHELCGTMTALALAQRDVLGVNMPLWKMLSLPVFIHGMANFRGMKPIFKWNSATPWSEMQLSPLDMSDPSNMSQLIAKLFPKVMWLIILGRVLGYCVKNYYLIGRQAKKRISTYFGKRSAFSAELAAAEMLKKSKKGDK
mmetsp:Transcript_13305/g.19149  ORF Transcript_13305/g.19149 Transcript_13305/m.19149 type:complete len:412 (+) Transcript_13305:270-1505(+)